MVRITQLALAAGAPLVQLRCKDCTDRERLHHARRLRRDCARAGARCVVNDRTDLALAIGADGVHVGADDLPPAIARRLLGPTALVGATCRDAETARRLVAEGASYLGVGPVYASTTKAGLPDPIGPRGIAAVAAAVDVPVIAIGGVTAQAVPELLAAGAWGVAVVAAVYGAPDPAAAITALWHALDPAPGDPLAWDGAAAARHAPWAAPFGVLPSGPLSWWPA